MHPLSESPLSRSICGTWVDFPDPVGALITALLNFGKAAVSLGRISCIGNCCRLSALMCERKDYAMHESGVKPVQSCCRGQSSL